MIINYSGDDGNQAFVKYNNHLHKPATPADFRFYNLSVGDEVYIYDDALNSVSPSVNPLVVDYITGNTIRLNQSVTATIQNTSMYVGAPVGDPSKIVIPAINIEAGSQYVRFYQPNITVDWQSNQGAGNAGFLTPARLATLLTYQLKASHRANTYTPVAINTPNNLRITDINLISDLFLSDLEIVYYNPEVPGHILTDFTTLTKYANVSVLSTGISSFSLVDAEMFGFESIYPDNKARGFIPKGSSIFIWNPSVVDDSTAVVFLTCFNILPN